MKRWKDMDNVFKVVLGMMLFFSWMDAKQIAPFHIANSQLFWDLYNQYTGPAIWSTWYMVLAAIGLIWYIITKDKSEGLAIVGASWSLLFFGTQDLFYFFFSPQQLTSGMCWADAMAPIRIISDLLGECCPSQTAFVLSGLLGVFVSYFVYNKLKRAKW